MRSVCMSEVFPARWRPIRTNRSRGGVSSDAPSCCSCSLIRRIKARRSDQELQNCGGGYCSVRGRLRFTCRCSGRLWMISRVGWSSDVSESQ